MKGQRKWKNTKRKKDNGKLLKYMESVDEFVQSKGGCEEVQDDHGLRFVRKKSRKELRKEKRKMKKSKMKGHYEGKKVVSLPLGDGEDSGITLPADTSQPQRVEVKEKVKKEVSKTQKSKSTDSASEKSKTQSISKKGKKANKLQESRKKALLEANEAEDREIKKLERYLGLNRRKNKKTLPQSFANDGLDYILGVLDSGSSAVGMYDSDEDMDTAKEKFEMLDASDTQISGEEEEPEDESANEGSGDEDLDSIDKEKEDDKDDDDEIVDAEEEEEMEEDDDEDELDESDEADSANESEGEPEKETDTPNTKASGSKTETVSS